MKRAIIAAAIVAGSFNVAQAQTVSIEAPEDHQAFWSYIFWEHEHCQKLELRRGQTDFVFQFGIMDTSTGDGFDLFGGERWGVLVWSPDGTMLGLRAGVHEVENIVKDACDIASGDRQGDPRVDPYEGQNMTPAQLRMLERLRNR